MNNYDKLHTNDAFTSCSNDIFAVKLGKLVILTSKECVMSYSHLLVSVAVSPESHQLVARAVSIARPANARISLITLAAEPEMYNQLAAPMLEDIREVLQEETHQFLQELVERADYPIHQTVIATGELSAHILDICQKENIDLVICGNHNQSFFLVRHARQNLSFRQARLMSCWCLLGAINAPGENQASLGKVAIFFCRSPS